MTDTPIASDDGCNVLPLKEYPDSIKLFGSKNVEQALIFVNMVSDPRTGLAIVLGADDESVGDILHAAFAADRRQDLNSESWSEKLSDATDTIRYTFNLALTLLPCGDVRVTDPKGDVLFHGNEWYLVRWVRDMETTMIDADRKEDEACLT